MMRCVLPKRRKKISIIAINIRECAGGGLIGIVFSTIILSKLVGEPFINALNVIPTIILTGAIAYCEYQLKVVNRRYMRWVDEADDEQLVPSSEKRERYSGLRERSKEQQKEVYTNN